MTITTFRLVTCEFFCCVCDRTRPDHHVPLAVAQPVAQVTLQYLVLMFPRIPETTHTQDIGLPAGSCALCFQRTGTDLAWVQCATFAVFGVPYSDFRKSAQCIGQTGRSLTA